MNDKKIYKINNIDVQNKKIGSFLGESKYYFFEAIECGDIFYFENVPLKKDQVVSKDMNNNRIYNDSLIIKVYTGDKIDTIKDHELEKYKNCKNAEEIASTLSASSQDIANLMHDGTCENYHDCPADKPKCRNNQCMTNDAFNAAKKAEGSAKKAERVIAKATPSISLGEDIANLMHDGTCENYHDCPADKPKCRNNQCMTNDAFKAAKKAEGSIFDCETIDKGYCQEGNICWFVTIANLIARVPKLFKLLNSDLQRSFQELARIGTNMRINPVHVGTCVLLPEAVMDIYGSLYKSLLNTKENNSYYKVIPNSVLEVSGNILTNNSNKPNELVKEIIEQSKSGFETGWKEDVGWNEKNTGRSDYLLVSLFHYLKVDLIWNIFYDHSIERNFFDFFTNDNYLNNMTPNIWNFRTYSLNQFLRYETSEVIKFNNKLEKAMLRNGPDHNVVGGILFIQLYGNTTRVGHIIAWVVCNGKIMFIDSNCKNQIVINDKKRIDFFNNYVTTFYKSEKWYISGIYILYAPNKNNSTQQKYYKTRYLKYKSKYMNLKKSIKK